MPRSKLYPQTSRRMLKHREVMELGNVLTEAAKNPDLKGIGLELLTVHVNEQLNPDQPYNENNVRSLTNELGIADYFRAYRRRTKPVSDEIEQRLQKLEAELQVFKERLGICEKKWIEHIVPKHQDDNLDNFTDSLTRLKSQF